MPTRKRNPEDLYSRKKSSRKSKLNCDVVMDKIKYLWYRKKYTKQAICLELNISKSGLDKVTKNWKYDKTLDKSNKRCCDYNIAYCLLFEHGLTYKQAAFVLEVKENVLRQVIRRNKYKIEQGFKKWKIEYENLRKSWKPEFLYNVQVAARLRHEREIAESNSNLIPNAFNIVNKGESNGFEHM